jgi:glyoxylase-like metal-dependent hydrolase (beta-lactamase superfamily II)
MLAAMLGEEIRPGLWRWVAYHEKWKQDVGCVALLDSTEAPVLIDPLLAADTSKELLGKLHRPPHVLITLYYHCRSAAEIARAIPGTRIWAPRRAAAAARRRAPLTDPFRPGDPLPGATQSFPTARSSEVVFWLSEHRTLVPGDVLLGNEEGGLRLCPRSWLPSGRTHAELRETLRPLLELPVELVLVSHGEPVLEDGHAALAQALRA